MAESHDKPKIIVDEDWKSQVERERQQVQEEETGSEQPEGMPPASFEILVSSLATQAVAALGQFPDPNTGKAMVSLPYAKFNIDLLAVLDEKTQGNQTEEEKQLIEEALHQLRMLYLAVEQNPQIATTEQP